MKIEEIYNLSIEKARKNDFRTEEEIEQFLERKKRKFEKKPKEERNEIDMEALTNPYLDSRILHVAEDKDIKKVLVGIDIEPAEILLAKEIGGIDLIISHHPRGKALLALSDVMELQCDILNKYGVPINIAEGLMKEKMSEAARDLNKRNYQRTVDTARLLSLNLMCLHTVCDNLAASFLKKKIEGSNPERIEDLMNLLKDIPEYEEASRYGAGPEIFVGDQERRCGKIALTEVTGGAEGSPKLYEKMAQVGIGTIVGMHVSEEHKKEAETANINVVITGHISSDSLGVNLFLDELEKKGIEIIPCSGLIRVSRA